VPCLYIIPATISTFDDRAKFRYGAACLNVAKLDYAQRVNEVTMMPSFSPSPAPSILRSSTRVLSNEKDDLPSTSSFYGLAFTEDLCSFHSRQTGPDLIKYSLSRLLSRGVAVAMSPSSFCCVLRNSDQVDRGKNIENFYLSRDRQAARSKHKEKRPGKLGQAERRRMTGRGKRTRGKLV